MGSPIIFAGSNAKLLKANLDLGEAIIKSGTFAAANNQSSATDVTGLDFANASYRAAKVTLSVAIDATADLFEVFELMVVQKTSSWDISSSSTGDISNVNFSITTAGQIQYTSGNETGFSSSTIKWVADVLDV